MLLASWENWALFDGFYFSFITMTTVGFGDIVPIKREFFPFDLFYIIVGLAITTMCIDLVGIEYIEKVCYLSNANSFWFHIRSITLVAQFLVPALPLSMWVVKWFECRTWCAVPMFSNKNTVKEKLQVSARMRSINSSFGVARKSKISTSLAYLSIHRYAPKDLAYIRFIDFGSLASFESISSLLSSMFTGRKSREPSLPSSV